MEEKEVLFELRNYGSVENENSSEKEQMLPNKDKKGDGITRKYGKYGKKRKQSDCCAFVIFFSVLGSVCILAVFAAFFLYFSIAILPTLLIFKYEILQFPPETVVENGKFYYLNFSKDHEPLKVLELEGSEYEMGYAHGRIFGYMIQKVVLYELAALSFDLKKYNQLNEDMNSRFNQSAYFYYQEFQGFYDASIDEGVDMYVKLLDRDWDMRDLWTYNLIYDWNVHYRKFMCSAVGVSKEFSEIGYSFVGRILDFDIDPKGFDAQANIITIINKRILSFNFPGFLGIMTGFNFEGIWLSNDNSNFPGDYDFEGVFAPMSLLARRYLEETTEGSSDISVYTQDFFQRFNFFPSFLYLVANDFHSFVLEGLNQVVAFRNEGDDVVILTNHLRKLATPIQCDRYARYELYFQNKDKVDQGDVKDIQIQNQLTTLLCTQFIPSTLTFTVGNVKISGIEGLPWYIVHKGCQDSAFGVYSFNFNDFI